jgi:hypothetical protein
MKPLIHARSSAKKYGGTESDYVQIHNMMDSTKSFIADNRHRAIFHTSAGIFYMEKMFGIDYDKVNELMNKYNLPPQFETDLINLINHNREHGVSLKNTDGKLVSVRDIAEQHVLEDYKHKFIPTPQDFLQGIPYEDWMQNGNGYPSSCKFIEQKIKTKRYEKLNID